MQRVETFLAAFFYLSFPFKSASPLLKWTSHYGAVACGSLGKICLFFSFSGLPFLFHLLHNILWLAGDDDDNYGGALGVCAIHGGDDDEMNVDCIDTWTSHVPTIYIYYFYIVCRFSGFETLAVVVVIV